MEDKRRRMMFPSLFSPIRIGRVELKNRIIFPPIATNLAHVSGEISERQVFHYARRAQGGAGLIIVENACIEYPDARHGATQPRIDSDEFIPGLAKLARAVHDAGAAISIELTHPGLNASLKFNGGRRPVAPSPVRLRNDGVIPKELTVSEIKRLVELYAQAALRAKRAGFDMVELQGAHGLLINQFLSPLTNRRTDQYGGSRENRLRFVREIVERIRELCGERFPITIRLAADDMVEGGIDQAEGKALAAGLEELGIDMIQADLGLCPKEKRLEPMPYPQGWRAYLAKGLKEVVSIPVAAVGVIREPEFAEELLERGDADLVALGRALIADPDWPNKARAGHPERIRRCIGCGECVKARHHEDQPLRCGVNPVVGMDAEFERITPAPKSKRILVIGGGPAGMEAARVAALRGHAVTLCDEQKRLGGTLNIAAIPPGKEKIRWLIEYYENELPRLGVEVKLRTHVTRATVEDLQPDVVIIATGCTCPRDDIPGADRPNVATAHDVLSGTPKAVKSPVVIIGGGLLGLETALFLAEAGHSVTVLKRYKTIASNLEPIYRDYLLRELKEHNVSIITEVTVERITDQSVRIKDTQGRVREIPAASVVLARNPIPRRSLQEELHGFATYSIGDCVYPGKIVDAVRSGYIAGRQV